MHAARFPGKVPRFLRRERTQRREQAAQRVEHRVHHRLRRAPPHRPGLVAVHPVLGDVHVQAAQVHRAKLVERVVDLVELERRVRFLARRDDLLQPVADPAIHERVLVRHDGVLRGVEVREVAQQDAQGVAQAPVRLRQPVEHLLAERHLVGEVHGC